MKRILIILIPIILLIISIISSFIAFGFNNKLEDGYIYITGANQTSKYEAEYNLIIGNLEQNAYSISIFTDETGVQIKLFDESQSLLKEYLLVVKEGSTFDQSIIEDVLTNEYSIIDELDETILSLNLKKDITYTISLTEIENNGNDQEIDLVLYYLPYDTYNKKRLFENVAFTTLIFSFISTVTILGAKVTKQE